MRQLLYSMSNHWSRLLQQCLARPNEAAPSCSVRQAQSPAHHLQHLTTHSIPPCSAVEQLVEVSQTRAVADGLMAVRRQLAGPWRAGKQLSAILDSLEQEMDREVGSVYLLCTCVGGVWGVLRLIVKCFALAYVAEPSAACASGDPVW